jgi:hypothetical protein
MSIATVVATSKRSVISFVNKIKRKSWVFVAPLTPFKLLSEDSEEMFKWRFAPLVSRCSDSLALLCREAGKAFVIQICIFSEFRCNHSNGSSHSNVTKQASKHKGTASGIGGKKFTGLPNQQLA